MNDDDDFPNGGRSLLLRMSKEERRMLEYLYKLRFGPIGKGSTRSGMIRALIRRAYSLANGKRKRQLGEPF